jgi:hypothetical protein
MRIKGVKPLLVDDNSENENLKQDCFGLIDDNLF